MKKILIIEDNLEVRENLAEILELSNYEVVTSENGVLGVEQALKDTPDLILCDVMMPELDGFGVLKILSKKPQTSDVPFIFLTAKAEKTDMRKGMNLGADDYITKPFDDVELLDAIEMRLKKSERLKEIPAKTENTLNAFIDEARGYEALKDLSKERQTREYRKKDIIYREGEFPRQLYFVRSGKVKIFKTNEDGKEFITEILKEGEFFGFADLINGKPFGESAASMEESEITFIPKEDFFQLLFANKDVSSKMIKMLADNIAEREEQLLNLAYNSIRRRVADALLILNERFEKEGKSTEISILRDDLASMVGTAKETVIRTLTDFKHEGIISIESGMISIKQLEKLKNMPN
jgi:CRP-like cAMP-binding protein/ActR/RegA family two-component response regulator